MRNEVTIFSQRELIMWAGPEAMLVLTSLAERRSLPRGEILFSEGEMNARFYMLRSGRLTAAAERWGAETVEIKTGRAVGESAVFTGQPYAATVVATEDCELLSISRDAFNEFTHSFDQLQEFFEQIVTPRLYQTHLQQIIRQLFGELNDDVLMMIQDQVSWQHLKSGETLYEEGETADDMAIIITGQLQVLVDDPAAPSEPRLIAELRHGEIVGEMALISNRVRSATVKALRQTDIVRLNRVAFEAIIQSYPAILMNVTRTLVERTQMNLSQRYNRRKTSLNYAVMFLHEPQVELVDQIAYQIEQSKHSARVMDADRIATLFKQPGVGQAEFGGYLNLMLNKWVSETELQYDFTFLVADSSWSNWTIRSLRSADRLIIVADATRSHLKSPIEAQIETEFPSLRTELLLVHPPETQRPENTRLWLESRSVAKHYHLRMGDSAHFKRIARTLSSQANGLVLSGGGAVGIAHIGVLKALDESQLPVDMIGGTSMGALIAANYAIGRTGKEMAELAELLSQPKNILDWTIPLVSFIQTRKVSRLLHKLLGDIYIEDLWIPFFCVSTNLTNSEPFYHHAGLLWRSVRTSTAIPVAMSPMRLDSTDLHVDGSIMNNFPADKMHELVDGGKVFGVIVSPVQRVEEELKDLTDHVSGWRVLLNRLNWFSPQLQIPSLANTFFRALLVNSKHHFHAVEPLTDYLITVKQEGIGFMEIDRYPELIELGHQVAQIEISKWGLNGSHENCGEDSN